MQLPRLREIDHEEGVAYGFIMAVAFVICASICMAILSPMSNGILDVVNGEIEDGHVSVQTASAIQWNIQAMTWLPVFALVGIFLWAVVRALEQKRLGT
jgi:hypothetical protein